MCQKHRKEENKLTENGEKSESVAKEVLEKILEQIIGEVTHLSLPLPPAKPSCDAREDETLLPVLAATPPPLPPAEPSCDAREDETLLPVLAVIPPSLPPAEPTCDAKLKKPKESRSQS